MISQQKYHKYDIYIKKLKYFFDNQMSKPGQLLKSNIFIRIQRGNIYIYSKLDLSYR